MVKIVKQDYESIDRALRRFKKQVLKEGMLQEYKKHMFYEKPGEMRRRRKKQYRKNWMKDQASLNTTSNSWIRE